MRFNVFKKIGLFVSVSWLCTLSAEAAKYQITSPDGKLGVTVSTDGMLSWQMSHNGTAVIVPSKLSMTLGNGEVLGQKPTVQKVSRKTVNTSFKTPFYKKDEVVDHYNQLLLACKGNYSVEFRVYDDGAAYRFITKRKGAMTVKDETAEFNFDKDYDAFVPYINDMRYGERYSFSFESYYNELKVSDMQPDSLSIVPLLVCLDNQKKATIMDGGTEDYPGMFLIKNGAHNLRGCFAPYPEEGKLMTGEFTSNFIATKRGDYLAKTQGSRTFPWRAVVVSSSDKELANNDMAQKLAAPSRIDDVSWIKPGKVAWDWWNNWNVTKVDFKAGINTETYKYYIDFAAANKLEYLIVDAGWSKKTLLDVIPEMDIPALVEYGNQKGVGILLWAGWDHMDAEMEQAIPHYAKMGIKGFKVDFIDCDDQRMMNSVYKIAAFAAKHKLMLDYHGLKANGMQRTYPNVVNFEGVKGLENNKWAAIIDGKIRDDAPRYDVTIPFTRMLVGPMDYTPGAMQNANRANFRAINDRPMSQGTRVHQMAMYTVYEAPLQMLADSPTAYMAEQECCDFMAQVPTVFNRTEVIDGQVGEYIIMARQKDGVWYIGAMTNWTPRTMDIDFSFLGDGQYSAEIFSDGINADREPTDYRKATKTITKTTKEHIQMFPGGGWTAILKPIK